MPIDRRVLQLLGAPLDPTDGTPVYRVAHYSCGTLTTAPVVAWALVRYGREDDEAAYEVVEPVFHRSDYGMMWIGDTEGTCGLGRSPDVVLMPHQEATGIHWTDIGGDKPRRVATIEVEEARSSAWSEQMREIPEGEAKPAGVEPR
jgi:hypothetical protein